MCAFQWTLCMSYIQLHNTIWICTDTFLSTSFSLCCNRVRSTRDCNRPNSPTFCCTFGLAFPKNRAYNFLCNNLENLLGIRGRSLLEVENGHREVVDVLFCWHELPLHRRTYLASSRLEIENKVYRLLMYDILIIGL